MCACRCTCICTFRIRVYIWIHPCAYICNNKNNAICKTGMCRSGAPDKSKSDGLKSRTLHFACFLLFVEPLFVNLNIQNYFKSSRKGPDFRIKHSAPSIKHRGSNIEHQTSSIQNQTSHIKQSNIKHPAASNKHEANVKQSPRCQASKL